MNIGDYVGSKSQVKYGYVLEIGDVMTILDLDGNHFELKREDVYLIEENIEDQLNTLYRETSVSEDEVMSKLKIKEKCCANLKAVKSTISKIEGWFKSKPCCSEYKISYSCDGSNISIVKGFYQIELSLSDEGFAEKLKDRLTELVKLDMKDLKERKIEFKINHKE